MADLPARLHAYTLSITDMTGGEDGLSSCIHPAPMLQALGRLTTFPAPYMQAAPILRPISQFQSSQVLYCLTGNMTTDLAIGLWLLKRKETVRQ